MTWQRAAACGVMVGLAVGLAASASADPQALFISQTGSLKFGSIVVGAVPGTVSVAPTGERSASGGVLLGNSGGSSPASFSVSGEPNTAYQIVLPSSAQPMTGPDQNMTFDSFTTSTAGPGSLNAGGTQIISVGATLHVNANQGRGSYAGLLPVTVSYD
jgi:hypothetical protein